jgi:autotransporter-associated beta strand protein
MKTENVLTALAVAWTMSAASVWADVATFSPTDIASGVSWAPNYDPIPSGGDNALEVGSLIQGGTQYQCSGQLRFDVSSLNGLYTSIESMTIQLYTAGSWAGRVQNTMSVYQLSDANASWTTGWTWGSAWAGGPSGATIAGTDYATPALGSGIFNPGGAAGSVVDIVIPGNVATTLINQWSSGGTNQGFLLYAPDVGGDSRCLFAPSGANGPKLVVQYATPEAGPLSAYWKGANSTSWTGGNWATDASGGTATSASPASATNVYFSVTGGGSNVSTTLDADFTIKSLNFTAAADAAHAVTIGGNALTIRGSSGITVDNGSGSHTINPGAVILSSDQTWTDNSANVLTIGAPVSGANLTIAGTGMIVFTNTTPSTYGTTTINSGAILQLGNNDATGTLGSGAVTNDGSLILNRSDDALTIGSPISGSGSLSVVGSGVVALTANNTFTGGTTVNGGILSLTQNNNAFNASALQGTLTINPGATLQVANFPFGYGGGLTALNVNGGYVTGSGLGSFGIVFNLTGGTIDSSGRLDLGTRNGVNGAINSLASSATSLVGSNNLMLRGDSGETSYTFDVAKGTTSSGIDLQFNTSIVENAGPCSLIKTGDGTMVLTAADTYTGGTDVRSGTLIVASADGLKDRTSLTVGAQAKSIFAATPVGPSVSPVPEPGTLALLAAGLGLGFVVWRRGRT